MSGSRGSSAFPVCLGIAAVIGAVLGWMYFPEPRAIDGALVLARIVIYPPDSAQGIYFHNMWTALHQVLALPLWLGVSQAFLIELFNAALGASLAAGLALVMFALTERAGLSIAVALLVAFGGVFLKGPDYPILIVSGHSFGQVASSLSVLCIGLLGNRRYFSAGFVAALLPSLHPVVGCWMIGVGLAGSLLVPAAFKADTPRFLKGLACGLLVSAVSFGIYWLQRTPVTVPVDAAAYSAYLENWDAHRNTAYSLKVPAVTALALASLWLLLDGGKRLDKPQVVQTAIVLMVAAVSSQAAYDLVHGFHADLPTLVSSAMLGRLVNLHFLLIFPVIAGVLCLQRETAPVLLLAAVSLAAPRHYRSLPLVLVVSLAAALIVRWLRSGQPNAGREYGLGNGYAGCIVGFCVAGAIIGLYPLSATRQPPCSTDFVVLENCRIPDVFREIQKLDLAGLVAAPTGLAAMLHRHAHKPVILGASGFDFVPYLPQTAAQVRDVLESLFGLDFRRPPEGFRRRGNLMPGMAVDYWSGLAPHDWKMLASRFCLGAVVAPSVWKVQLEPAFEADGIRVYVLPGRPSGRCQLSL